MGHGHFILTYHSLITGGGVSTDVVIYFVNNGYEARPYIIITASVRTHVDNRQKGKGKMNQNWFELVAASLT